MNTTLNLTTANHRFDSHKNLTSSQAASSLTPDNILQIGLGFWPSKALLSAAELGLFSELARGPLDAETLRQRLGLHERGIRDFLDALVALRFLERHDDLYSNTPESDLFLDHNKPTYVGGILEMCNARLFGHWNNLTDALRTGKPQNENKNCEDTFAALYSSPEKLESFLKGMTGISLGSAKALAEKIQWSNYRTVADVGAAEGAVPVQLALAHPHLKTIGYDLPVVLPVFEKYAAANGVADRVRFHSGDFFKDTLPKVDVIIMGHILHDWNLEQKYQLIQKAYDALPKGGAFIVFESLIDDDRRENAMGLLMSLNMLIETPGGFDYTGADCKQWLRDAGFLETRVEHLAGPDWMVIGIK
ncbi:MAG: methyltransferase [Limisphaerales bacterium]